MQEKESLRSHARTVSKERGLDMDVVKAAIEDAIVQASKKNLSAYRDAVCSFDMEKNEVTLRVTKAVVRMVKNPRLEISLENARKINPDANEGDDVQVNEDPAAFSRIASQLARQLVRQRLRDAECDKVVGEYLEKVGQLVSGEVARTEKRNIIIKLAKGEGVLKPTDTPHPSRHRPGERLKLLVVAVDREAKGPMVQLSRSHPQLVAELFRQEVPEISDGVVEILGVAREPGVRSKIAVHSKNPDVDPVGACVGMKGSRVQMVVRELEGERIDIVEWNADAVKFIKNALNPAEILSVHVDHATLSAEVLVAKGNLSLAIGKKGQNARLAAKLTGWKINVRSEEEASDKANELAGAEIQRRYLEDFVAQIEAITGAPISAFGKQEFNTVEKIASAPIDRLRREIGGDEELARVIQAGAREYSEALKEMMASAVPAAAASKEAVEAFAAAPAEAASAEAPAVEAAAADPGEGEAPRAE